jgi:hypothetical protein
MNDMPTSSGASLARSPRAYLVGEYVTPRVVEKCRANVAFAVDI